MSYTTHKCICYTLSNNKSYKLISDNNGTVSYIDLQTGDGVSDPLVISVIETEIQNGLVAKDCSSINHLDLIENGGKLECDERVLTKSTTSITLNDTYFGWSEPEGVQWSNIPAWDNRSWKVWFDQLDTDGIGATSTPISTSAFTSFQELIDELNNQLLNYGSSFRLIGHQDGNRILVADLSLNPLLIGDPYLTTYNFQNMELIIEDALTGSDWLVKGRNPKDLTLNNVDFGVTGYSFKTYPCPKSICEQLKEIPDGVYDVTDKIVVLGQAQTLDVQGWFYDGINTGNGFMEVPFTSGNQVSVNALIVDGIDYIPGGPITNTYLTFQDFLNVVNGLITASGVQLATSSDNDFYIVGSDINPIIQVLVFDFYDDTASAWFTKTWLPNTIQIQVEGECKLVELTLPEQGWSLQGNAGTDPNVDFIGTTDAEPLVFKTNNVEAVRIDTNGYVGIGTNSPTDLLHVLKNINAGVSILLENQNNNASAYCSIGVLNGDILAGYGSYKAGNYAYNGTSSNHDFRITTNNLTRMNFDKNGNIAAGNFTPTTKFHTQGTLRFEGLAITSANTRFLTVDSTGVVTIKNENQIKYGIRTVTANTTLANTDYTVIFNGSNLTATLPISVIGTVYNIKNANTTNLSITGNIDGAVQILTIGAGDSRTFHGDGTTWFLI